MRKLFYGLCEYWDATLFGLVVLAIYFFGLPQAAQVVIASILTGQILVGLIIGVANRNP